MPFRKILEELLEAAGAAGAVMVDNDGEVVASVSGEEGAWDMELVGAHHALVLDVIREAGSRVEAEQGGRGGGWGGVESIVITTASARVVVSALKEDYSLVVLLVGRAPAAKALFESKQAVKQIEKEMG
jgi:predicted regulator of Ras-like GTPase activity (Roadblock/LC7/MglB family)